MENQFEFSNVFYNKRTNQFCQFLYITQNGYKTLSAGLHPFDEVTILTIPQCRRLLDIGHEVGWSNLTPEQVKEILYENGDITNEPYINPTIDEVYVKWHYNPKYGDSRECECGHPYHRHFDSYENMSAVGCKYCECGEFVEKLNKEII